MTTLLIARDAVLFLMAFEVMTVSAFFLVTTEDQRPDVREAGWVYLAASHASFVLLIATFTALAALTGSFDLVAVAPESIGPGPRSVLFLLALVAFGVKAGIMPFHVWLPSAHASAPSHVSALMSGVVIKIGIYGIVRVLAMLPEPPVAWGVLLLVLGAVSGIGGVAFAIAQHDIKRLLAYHSIENIGIIVMGIGLAVVGRATHAHAARGAGARGGRAPRLEPRHLQGAALPVGGRGRPRDGDARHRPDGRARASAAMVLGPLHAGRRGHLRPPPPQRLRERADPLSGRCSRA